MANQYQCVMWHQCINIIIVNVNIHHSMIFRCIHSFSFLRPNFWSHSCAFISFFILLYDTILFISSFILTIWSSSFIHSLTTFFHSHSLCLSFIPLPPFPHSLPFLSFWFISFSLHSHSFILSFPAHSHSLFCLYITFRYSTCVLLEFPAPGPVGMPGCSGL